MRENRKPRKGQQKALCSHTSRQDVRLGLPFLDQGPEGVLYTVEVY